MTIYDEPKIDCHNHVFDPDRFPYAPDTPYAPSGQEIGTATQLTAVLDAYGVGNALVVGPNSGYGEDSSCLLDVLESGAGRFAGAAVVPNDVSRAQLAALRAAGVLGVTFNVALLGVAHYRDTARLLADLADLAMFVDVQVAEDQLIPMLPLLAQAPVELLVDHCGRPSVEIGVGQPGFEALLRLADTDRVTVKLSGLSKFSREPYPFRDTWPYVRQLVSAFGFDALVWGSDWPFLRSPTRVDYGPLLTLVEELVPVAADRRRLLWDTPRRLFGFADRDSAG